MGIVVLYHPLPNVRSNILSYLYGLDKLILWRNSPNCDNVLPKGIDNYADKIITMGDEVNVGIGKPYNEAIAHARRHGYTHLLTMDQDSSFDEEGFRKYLTTILEAGEGAIFTPNCIIHGKKKYPVQEGLLERYTIINSGTLYPLSVFDAIGTFREDFFMDTIDTDIALRAKKSNIPRKVVCSVILNHEAGYQTRKRKFLWKTITPNEYSPMRSYYIVRNGLVAKAIYPDEEYWRYYLRGWFYKRILCVLLYEDNKWAKLEGLITGYIHGKRGITGIRKRYHPDISGEKLLS